MGLEVENPDFLLIRGEFLEEHLKKRKAPYHGNENKNPMVRLYD